MLCHRFAGEARGFDREHDTDLGFADRHQQALGSAFEAGQLEGVVQLIERRARGRDDAVDEGGVVVRPVRRGAQGVALLLRDLAALDALRDDPLGTEQVDPRLLVLA